jgi:FO synthase
MGMMLETTSRRLFEEPGQVHYGSPDKDPAVRLAVIEDAGRARIPFTTGVLIGIGETVRDRAESLVAIRDAHERNRVDGQGHVQEVIVQNFRAKDHTAMRAAADAETLEYVAAVAVARLVMGPDMRIQVPPNLSDPTELELLVRAGADDWGGVSPLTADHVNPERPWPHLDDLAAKTAELGFELRERLTAQPPYVRAADEWIDEGLRPLVLALAAPDGLAAAPAVPAHPQPIREPSSDSRAFDEGSGNEYGLGAKALIERAASEPASLDDAEWARLLQATGDDLNSLAITADDVRRYTVGEAVTLVVNRNLTSTGYRALPEDDPATFTLDDVTAIAMDAADLGATELCVQGRLPASEDPSAYLEIVRAARGGGPRAPPSRACTCTPTARRTSGISRTAADWASTQRWPRCATPA